MKIKSITTRQYSGLVYNIGTTPDHNYFANGVLVHNCYQGSTTDGKHASMDEIKQIIRTLAENEVFEIAFGGGEPTQHPDFIEILKETKEQYIIPNFTTKNLKWIKKHIEEIEPYFGSFAYSVTYATDITELAIIRDFYGIHNHRVCAQFVLGVESSDWALQSIIEACSKYGVPLTLLGFKSQHRGATFKRKYYDNWLTIVKQVRDQKQLYCKIGIDTALATEYSELLATEFPDWLYHKEEGTFSCYIDAVDKKMGRSSYHELESYSHITNDFIDLYEKY